MNNEIANSIHKIGAILGKIGFVLGIIGCVIGLIGFVIGPLAIGGLGAVSIVYGIISIITSIITKYIFWGFAEIIEQLTLFNLNTNNKLSNKHSKTIPQQLKDIKTLLDDDLISKEEFENKKAELLKL
ncbi:SHOCT domain-containing protein [Clostridium beijerinckii]|uniref:SHOCT domain-containing protein n=1 Tax=Clostridium beijerinckii TaxID=1520 RepID=A0A1S9N4E1_CLOBE|nr:SHOCT domain-containing protein [Clostridium beijerinckii]MZK51453.1 hypothetical protein [Clostridium beijerinckii]MZK59653.1 hypothetical protein [Clostridium beijerinckii]MZK69773.1 hypothetical protein [Clostridium beijerinckii]MZK75151.1 hypothetical protein [Clostridium beijerinckii]MZK84863.1 hypothetical protein [Clostridium beijerinckii]